MELIDGEEFSEQKEWHGGTVSRGPEECGWCGQKEEEEAGAGRSGEREGTGMKLDFKGRWTGPHLVQTGVLDVVRGHLLFAFDLHTMCSRMAPDTAEIYQSACLQSRDDGSVRTSLYSPRATFTCHGTAGLLRLLGQGLGVPPRLAPCTCVSPIRLEFLSPVSAF